MHLECWLVVTRVRIWYIIRETYINGNDECFHFKIRSPYVSNIIFHPTHLHKSYMACG